MQQNNKNAFGSKPLIKPFGLRLGRAYTLLSPWLSRDLINDRADPMIARNK